MKMNKWIILIFIGAQFWLAACSPVKLNDSNQYKLDSYSNKKLSSRLTHHSILITAPEAVTGYQTNQMLYVKKPYEISSFANNAWIGPPADMLYPLILQSVQRSGYFYAVASSPNAEQTNYRLDTQLIELQQNFITTPSEITLTAKFVLTNVLNSKVVASKVIKEHVRCPTKSPYGGVIAANLATKKLTEQLSKFIVTEVRRDS
jgi:cholesterol transport system auxiliary component